MNILLLSSTGLRHLRFASQLNRVYACDPVAIIAQVLPPPGWPAAYARRVWEAERQVFPIGPGSGEQMFLGVQIVEDINRAIFHTNYDLIVVFGSALITGRLLEACLALPTVNLHAGMSPFYRGSSCNFWAAYDGHPEYVGMTIHRLSAGVDAGDILEVVPAPDHPDPFMRGMLAVRAGQDRLIEKIRDGSIWEAGTPQDLTQTIRYSKRVDFTDAVAMEFLNRCPQ